MPIARQRTTTPGYSGNGVNVYRVTVVRQGLRNVAVVARIVHRGAHEAIDKHRARLLVYFIFDRIGVHWDFDNDVEVVRQIFAGWDVIQTHICFLKSGEQCCKP